MDLLHNAPPQRSSELPEISIPGSKSMTHRALILASMGYETCRIDGWLQSADTLATPRAIESCGAFIEHEATL